MNYTRAVSHHPRAGIAASAQKMQRGVESTVLGKAQIGPELENLQKLRCHHSGAGRCSCGAQGMCVALPGEELCCPCVQDWGIYSEGQ